MRTITPISITAEGEYAPNLIATAFAFNAIQENKNLPLQSKITE